MKIVEFDVRLVEQARLLAQMCYEEEQARVPALPPVEVPPMGGELAGNGLGCAAVEGERLVGFLCCWPPIDRAFTTKAKGVFSPIHAHGAVKEGRWRIFRELYRAVGQKWAAAGVASHSIGLYAHDSEAVQMLFELGFGQRCADLVRPMEPLGVAVPAGLVLEECGPGCGGSVRPLREGLARHLGHSPCFMRLTGAEVEGWLGEKEADGGRLFVAKHGSRIIAFLEVVEEGENFATLDKGMANICGAYCLPEHRGSGVTAALLDYATQTLAAEGYTRLGVDCESMNPEAYGFWRKYFDVYTYGLVRRIDESALGVSAIG